MTQKDFAEQLNKSYQHINSIFTGRIDAGKKSAKQIAAKLGDESLWPIFCEGAGTAEAKRERLKLWRKYRAEEIRKERIAAFNKAKQKLEAVL